MAFQVYAGCSGQRSGAYPNTNGWHPDCKSTGSPMALDIFAPQNTSVDFLVRNDSNFYIVYRYRVDCTKFLTGTPSSVVVELTTTVGVYLFRYAHLNVASDIPPGGWDAPWSDRINVSAYQTSRKNLGTLSEASVHYDTEGEAISGWIQPEGATSGYCSETVTGKTDIGGLCSSAPHLHQAASNNTYDGCISANASGHCGYTRGLRPGKLTRPPTNIYTSDVLFSA